MIVVTGGAGFIGSALVSKLNSIGIYDILIVDNLAKTEKWKNLVGKRFLDYCHKDDFIELLYDNHYKGEIRTIFHLGACSATTEKDADYLMENNYQYSKFLAQWAIEHKVKMIYASSAATYGDGSNGFDDNKLYELKPLNMYGFSKHLFDIWVTESEADKFLTGVKFFNVFGPNEYHKGSMTSVIVKAFKQISDTGELNLFKSDRDDYEDGKQMRDFIYVKDVCETLVWFLQHSDVSGIFNLGTGKANTWLDLGRAIFSAMNLPVKINFVEMPENLRGKYQYFTQADMTKLRKKGFEMTFTPLEDAVKDYVQNYLMKDMAIF